MERNDHLLHGLVGQHQYLFDQSAEFHAMIYTLIQTLPVLIDAYAAQAQTQLDRRGSEMLRAMQGRMAK